MTTKELIRAEIRKWQSNIEARCPESTRSRDYTKEEWDAIYEYNAYTRILSFLDTLPDEPVSNDLEEAAEKFARFYDNGTCDGVAQDCFIAGAEWQKAKMLKDNPVIMQVEDFQALIDSHAKRVEADYKQKMMEGAVEGVVYRYESYQRIATAIIVDVPKESLGNKVKIIIVKED